jgi:predicted Zn finger-like uncharacterized protein
MFNCPKCQSKIIVKNGHIHNGKQRFKCKSCGRQFVQNPTNKVISPEEWGLVDKLLLEKIPIAGISRVTGITEAWLQNYINKVYREVPKKITLPFPKKKDL